MNEPRDLVADAPPCAPRQIDFSCCEIEHPLATASTRRLRPGALRRALAFIEANMTERFTLDALAASAGISRFHFARLFRSTTGHSPMEYLMRVRVERSRSLLARGEGSICEIAASLGFCDQSHFTRTFRRMTGMSPRDFVRRSQSAATGGLSACAEIR